MLLMEENSQNYINFLKKMEEMSEAMEKKIIMRLDEKLDDFKLHTIESTPTKVKPKDRHMANLKNQRKQMTNNIVTLQRFKSQKSAEFVTTPTINVHKDKS